MAVALVIVGVSGSAWSADAINKGKPQTTCPVMGSAIDKSVYVDYNEYRIYFCCKDCPEKFKKNPVDPESSLKAAFKEAVNGKKE